jgi:stage V sporulation protein SpoVS
MEWIAENWQTLVAAVGAVVILARLIVKLTPTPADDAWLAKVVGALKHLGLHIADRSSGPGDNGSGGAAAALVLAAALGLLAAGCQAPAAVRATGAEEVLAWQRYVGNSERITGAAVEAYRQARQADIDYTTAKAVAAVKATAVDGKLPAETLERTVQEVIARRDMAKALTDQVAAKVQALLAANRKEAAKALQLHAALRDYLEAGIDESSIPAMIQEVLGLLGAPAPAGVAVPAVP